MVTKKNTTGFFSFLSVMKNGKRGDQELKHAQLEEEHKTVENNDNNKSRTTLRRLDVLVVFVGLTDLVTCHLDVLQHFLCHLLLEASLIQ